MSLTIAQARDECERAGVLAASTNGDGAGFRFLCPICSGEVTVTADDRGVARHVCSNGCDRTQIGYELFSRQLRAPQAAAAAPGSSWDPVDLEPILAGDVPEDQPEILRRTDGVGLLYHGRLHACYGEPEAGKGWFALAAAAELIAAAAPVLYVDYEDTPTSIVGRLRALGVAEDLILSRFNYVRPEDPLEGSDALAPLLSIGAELVIIDGVTEALAVEGLNMADNQDVAVWFKRLARPFARAGAAVLFIDHVIKDREGRGRYAIGAQHKLAGVDVAYRLDVIQPFGREREGLVKVTVTKDRPGHVRQHAVDRERIATLKLVSLDGVVTASLEPASEPGGAAFRPTVLMERVSKAIEASPGLSKRAVRESVTGQNKAKDLALELLVNDGYIDARRDGQAVKHYPLRPYEDEERAPVPHRAPTVPRHGSSTTVPPCPRPYKGHGAGHGHEGTPEEQDRAQRLLDDHVDLAGHPEAA